jgi:prepilin-type processing-associated H-X9-DG protein
VQTDSLMGSGTPSSASRRPVNGFTGGIAGPEYLYNVPPNGTFYPATVNDLSPDPEANPGAAPTTLLDWVGRNHDSKRKDSNGQDARRTNFLYLDGHVETKHVRDTLSPVFEWGDKFYTLQ